ncbi:MAG: glutamate--tRNA ligase, partial [Chloroflexi bacterium]|nr:glutamate--tRNA ligase [Chloroflexota bacterium]
PDVTVEDLLPIIPLIQTRITTLDEAPNIAGFFFKETVEPKPEELIAKKLDAAQSLEIARRAREVLAAVPEDAFTAENLEPPMRALVEEMGLKAGQVFGVVRVAVTGQRVSPPLFETLEIVGKAKTIERMDKAIEMLEKMV